MNVVSDESTFIEVVDKDIRNELSDNSNYNKNKKNKKNRNN